MTFDKFHIIKLMNAAVDKVRREEQMTIPALKLTRYLWLYNPNKLNAQKTKKLETLKKLNIKTAKAYQLKLTLQDIYSTATDWVDAMMKLNKWYQWAVRSRLKPVITFGTVASYNEVQENYKYLFVK